MFRHSFIALLALGLGFTSAFAQHVPRDTDNWSHAHVVLIGKVTQTTIDSVGKSEPPSWSMGVEIETESVLRGTGKVAKSIQAGYRVKQDNAPSFPNPKERCVIGLAGTAGNWTVYSIDVATKDNIDKAREATSVTKAIKLFNGKDLTNFYTYLGKPYQTQDDKEAKKKVQAFGKNNDPLKVFSVVDNSIRVSGEVFGCFTTEKEYENYRLVVEFKWGTKTWPPREKRAMDSGILLHCVGEDGAAGGVWMESIECQMIEGGTGDFLPVAGKAKPRITCPVEKRGNQWYYVKKDGMEKEFDGGRINWFARDPQWKDEQGFRGKDDIEKKAGEWNTLECTCDGDTITNVLNGTVVNFGWHASHTRGKILFQSEGAEVFFRRVELLPLKK